MKNKITKALVFGHSSGLGAALTKKLVERGVQVIGVSRRKSSLKSDRITNISIDLSDKKQVGRVIDLIKKNHSKFNTLFYCAGILTAHDIDNLSYDDMEELYRVNVFAPMAVESALYEQIKSNSADVVNITSSSIIDFYPKYSEYSSSKIAFKKFTGDLQKSLQETSCRVMEFCPSGFQSNIYKTMLGDKVSRNESIQMKAGDLADMILYFVDLPKKIEVASVWVNRK